MLRVSLTNRQVKSQIESPPTDNEPACTLKIDDLSKILDYKLLMIFFHDHNIKMTAILVSLEFTVHIPYLTVEVYTNFQILKSSHQCLHFHKSNSFRFNGVSARMQIKGCAIDLLN